MSMKAHELVILSKPRLENMFTETSSVWLVVCGVSPMMIVRMSNAEIKQTEEGIPLNHSMKWLLRTKSERIHNISIIAPTKRLEGNANK